MERMSYQGEGRWITSHYPAMLRMCLVHYSWYVLDWSIAGWLVVSWVIAVVRGRKASVHKWLPFTWKAASQCIPSSYASNCHARWWLAGLASLRSLVLPPFQVSPWHDYPTASVWTYHRAPNDVERGAPYIIKCRRYYAIVFGNPQIRQWLSCQGCLNQTGWD